MAKFMLHFERYIQMRAMVEVDAEDLAEAVAAADTIDTNALGWESDPDQEFTIPRLYGVLEDDNQYVAQVQLPHFSWSFSWTHVDLRHQWPIVDKLGSNAGIASTLSRQLEYYFRNLAPRLAVNR